MLDKGGFYDKLLELNVMTEPKANRRPEREGMVKALGSPAVCATSELPGMTGTPHPRYRMNRVSLPEDDRGGTVERTLHPRAG